MNLIVCYCIFLCLLKPSYCITNYEKHSLSSLGRKTWVEAFNNDTITSTVSRLTCSDESFDVCFKLNIYSTVNQLLKSAICSFKSRSTQYFLKSASVKQVIFVSVKLPKSAILRQISQFGNLARKFWQTA